MAHSSTCRGSRGLILIALAVSSAALLMAALPAAVAAETVQLRGSRSLLANTSPVPKPLFPPGCNCDRKQKNSPYRMEIDKSESYPVEIPTGKGGSYTLNRYCFRVDYEWGCDPRQKCCGKLGLHKVELDVGECISLACLTNSMPGSIPVNANRHPHTFACFCFCCALYLTAAAY